MSNIQSKIKYALKICFPDAEEAELNSATDKIVELFGEFLKGFLGNKDS